MSSNNASASLIPLDEYLSDVLFRFIPTEDFVKPRRDIYRTYDGSLALVNYKPMATSAFETSPGYMPFIIKITAPHKENRIGNPEDIEVKYGEKDKEKTIHLNLGNLSNIIDAYGFLLGKRHIYVNVTQGATSKDFVFDVIVLGYKGFIDADFKSELKSAEAKINTLIQTLESTNPTIRENFAIKYMFYNPPSSRILIPHIFLIPKGIVNDISDFLLSQYEQNYGITTKLPPDFTPNESVQSPELQKFLEKLPLDLIAEAVIGTYGSYSAILLPKGNYSQYLTGNERIVSLEKNDIIVFTTSQQIPAPQAQEQQNIEQNEEEENSNIDLNKLEKVSNSAIAEGLGKEIQSIYGSIIEDDTINVEKKKHRLKTLNEALDELGKAILDALKSQTPLNTNELRKYTEDIVKSAGLSYTNNFEYFLDYYENSLSETGKLEVLATLLTSIGNTMYDIDKKIKEYNSLQLTY